MNKIDKIADTESLCPICFKKIPAQKVMYTRDEPQVFLEKSCPKHGKFKTLIWKGKPDIRQWMRKKTSRMPDLHDNLVEKGCPYDCGLCMHHRQETCTALIEVTNRCNLSCSYCFAQAEIEEAEDPDIKMIEERFDRLLSRGIRCNLQLSGGEPTLREDLAEIIKMGRSKNLFLIQVNTNGIRIAQDEAYLKKLKEAGLDSIYLQFDSTCDQVYTRLRGRKLFDLKKQAIENCQKHQVGVVLVPTLVPEINTHHIGEMIKFALAYTPTVRGIHFQPVSYFGKIPSDGAVSNRLTIPEVIREIEKQTDGLIKADSFKPPGCENSFCSFHGNYIYRPDQKIITLTQNTSSCCSKTIKAEEGARKAKEAVLRTWSSPTAELPEKVEESSGWDEMLTDLRRHSFTISGMTFQDVWNLDLERVRDCCIHVVTAKGQLVPFCIYYLTNSHGKSFY
ncbi:radical SAM (seleno)protein TrsS [Clostridium formicaceticum]|nr:radical SAM (seleno)protein TrsS [Clostridium formicaceticum]AOY76456.1 radical SAM protein [Clostridium formicaceticum]